MPSMVNIKMVIEQGRNEALLLYGKRLLHFAHYVFLLGDLLAFDGFYYTPNYTPFI